MRHLWTRYLNKLTFLMQQKNINFCLQFFRDEMSKSNNQNNQTYIFYRLSIIILLFSVLYFFLTKQIVKYSVWKVKVYNFAHERDVYDYVQGFCSEIHNWCWGSTRSGKWKFAISVRLKEESYGRLIEFCRFLPVSKICSRNAVISKRTCVISCGTIANTLQRSRGIH